MARVKTHYRTVNGKRIKVRQHSRRLQPGRASRNAKRAYRHHRRGFHGRAALWGGLAAAEIAGWVTLKGVGVTAVTLGAVLVGLGLAANRATKDPSRPAQAPRRQAPATPRPHRPETAAEMGRRHASEDVAAGGFAKGWKKGDRSREMTEQETADYERAYSENTPRSWRD